jgi:hypothetical protein
MKTRDENAPLGADSPTIHDKLPPLAKPVGARKLDPGKTTMREKAPEPPLKESPEFVEAMRPANPVAPISQKLKKANVNSQPLKKAKSVNIKHLIEADVDSLKKQLQCYSDIFEKINPIEDVDIKNIIEPLNMLCRSLNYDAVSLLIVDSENPGKFLPVMSRGYKKNPPPLDVAVLFEEGIRSELPGLDWNKLMDLAGESNNVLGQWIMEESIKRIGYSPVHDGAIIHGMIIAASYGTQQPSQLASPLLELCGSRLGLHIGMFRHKAPASSEGENVPVDEIKNKFFVLKKYMELLHENKKLSETEITNLIANCDKALDEGIDVLEKALKEKN